MSRLAVTGKDVLGFGCPVGILVGKVLGEVLDKVIEDPSLNDREKLLPLTKKIVSSVI